MGAIGLFTKSGRYGDGIYAYMDIALEFASWILPEFKLYFIKDYKRLKYEENSRLSRNWNFNREIARLNYRIHTDAIKANLIPSALMPEQIAFTYANEADLLNVALFGQTAKQWKDAHPGKRAICEMRPLSTTVQVDGCSLDVQREAVQICGVSGASIIMWLGQNKNTVIFDFEM